MTQHLVHVGFPKSGSTTLSAWFAAHPELEYAPNGLGGFYHAFEIGARAVSGRPPAAWHVTSAETFVRPTASDAPSPLGPPMALEEIAASRARVCATLRGLFPGATILIVTRGFCGMIASGYSQYVRWGGARRLAGVIDELSADLDAFLDYDAVVGLYRDAFERVVVLPYELLRDDPGAFTGALVAQLGLEAPGPALPELNPALSTAGLHWYPLVSRPPALAARVLGARAGGLLFRAYVAWLQSDPLGPAAERLARRRPRWRFTEADVPGAVVERFRGRASALRSLPHFEPYAVDYLNDGR